MENVAVRQMSITWKKWIASNLLRGCPRKQMEAVLKQEGFNDAEIFLEIKTAETSPYLQAGMEFGHQLDITRRKRDWFLSTYDTIARLDKGYSQEIDVIETPPFEDFIKNYYSKHKPVLLKNGINHWEAMSKWTPQFFADTYGDTMMQIQAERESNPNFEIESPNLRKEVTMAEFVKMMNETESSNNFYITANNTAKNREVLRKSFYDLGDIGEGGYRKMLDDPTADTFFWMGPKGIFTPLHHDLTNNMLVQIYGEKRVTLIPAAQVPWLYNNYHVFSEVDFPDNVDYNLYPDMKRITPVDVIIEPGDALFIPIGWWHCVKGLSQVISVSFVNFNAPNDFFNSYKQIT